MKVMIQKILPTEEPYASLHIPQETEDIKRLTNYIETNQFQRVRIPCSDGDKLHHIDSRNLFYIESMNDVLYLHTLEGI